MGAVGVVTTEVRPGRIPFAAIDAYALRLRIDGGAFDLLCAMLGKLDSEFLVWDGEQARARAAARR